MLEGAARKRVRVRMDGGTRLALLVATLRQLELIHGRFPQPQPTYGRRNILLAQARDLGSTPLDSLHGRCRGRNVHCGIPTNTQRCRVGKNYQTPT
jgi:hypothetical protein